MTDLYHLVGLKSAVLIMGLPDSFTLRFCTTSISTLFLTEGRFLLLFSKNSLALHCRENYVYTVTDKIIYTYAVARAPAVGGIVLLQL